MNYLDVDDTTPFVMQKIDQDNAELHQTFQGINPLMWILDVETKQIKFLPTQATLSSTQESPFIELLLNQLNLSQSPNHLLNIINFVLETQNPLQFHWCLESHWVGIQLSPVSLQAVLGIIHEIDVPESHGNSEFVFESFNKNCLSQISPPLSPLAPPDSREILNHINDFIVRLDRKGRYLYVNQALTRATGISEKDYLGKTNEVLGFPKKLCQLWNHYFKLAWETGEAQTVEYDWKILNKKHSFQSVIYPEKNSAGVVLSLLITTRDITEEKQAIKDLNRKNQGTKLLADLSLKLRQSLDLETILKTTVEEFQGFLKADRVLIFKIHNLEKGTVVQESLVSGFNSLLGQEIFDPCLSRVNAQKYSYGNSSVIDNLEEVPLERCYRQLMEYFQVKAYIIVPILLGENQQETEEELAFKESSTATSKLWGLLIAHQCAMPRKWTDLEIDLCQQLADQVGIAIMQSKLLGKLHQTHQQLSFHLENSPLAVIEWDRQFHIHRWSFQAEKIFGWTAEEVLGQKWSEFPFIYEADYSLVNQRSNRLLEGLDNHQIGYNRNLTKDGKIIDCEWYNSVLRDEVGNLISVFSLVQDISDRKRAEKALIAAEERSRAMFEQAAIGLALVSPGGELVRVNQRYCDITGYSATELIGQSFQNLVYIDDLEASDRLEQLLTGTIPPFSREKRYCRKGNDLRWVQVSFSKIRDPLTNQNTALIALEDIHERKQAEDALRQSEERWQLALKGNNDGIWDWNIQNNEVFFSSRWKEMLGFTEDEIGNDIEEWTQRIHPDDFSWVMRAMRDHFDKKTPFYITEHRIRCKDGSYKWILDRGQALWDKAGNVMRMVGSNTDMSERKQTEQQLQQTRNFLQTIIDHLPVAVFVKEGREEQFGQFKLWNNACETIFGLRADQAIGRTFKDYFSAEQAEQLQAWDREAFITNFPQDIAEETIETPHRGQRILHTIKVPIYDDLYKPEYLLCISEDITERKHAEAALRDSEARYSSLTNDVLDQSAVGIFILDAAFKVVWINQATERFFGIQRQHVIGKDKRQFIRDRLQFIFEKPEEFAKTLIATYDNNTYIENFECHVLPHRNRQERWLEHLSLPIRSGLYAGGRIEHYTDITDRKRTEEELSRRGRALQTLSDCNQALVHANTETELLQEICEILVKTGGYRFAWVGYPQTDTEQTILPVAKAGYDAGYLEQLNLTWAENARGRGPSGTAVRTGKPSVFQNISTNPDYALWRDKAEQRGYASSAAVPLLRRPDFEITNNPPPTPDIAGLVFGVLNLYSGHANTFDEAEVKLLCELADDLAFGILALRIRKAHEESEEKFRQLAENIHDVFWMSNADGTEFLYVSPAYQRIWGRSCESLYQNYASFVEAIHPQDRARSQQFFQENLEKPFDLEYRIVRPDGEIRWIWDRGFPIANEAGNVYRRAGIAKDITQRKQTEELLRQANEDLELRVIQRTFELENANARLQHELMQRHRVEYKLRKSEEQYRTLVQNFPNGAVFLFDRNFRYTIADGVGLGRTGLSREKLEGKIIWDVLPKPLTQMVEPMYRAALAGETILSEIEYQNRMYYYQALPVRNEQQEILAGMVVMQDITERKQAEAERDKLIAIIEATPDFVSSSTPSGELVYFNQSARKILGIPLNASLKNRQIPHGHPDWANEIIEHEGIPTAILDGSWIGETALLSHDGREIPLSQLIIAHRNIEGQVYLLSTIARDITEQKRARDTLREAERRWRSLLENVRLLVVGLNRQGIVEYVNSFFLSVTGYTEAEVLGKSWFENFLPLHQQRLTRQYLQDVLEADFQPYYQNIILTQTGEERIIAWNNTLLHNLQGEVIGTMSIGEDITERASIERMKDEFISVVSHELRTPLTSIHGGLNLLANNLVDANSQRGQHVIKIAAESAERLVRLVNDILELERLESGKIHLSKQPVNANDLMLRAVEQMQLMANRAGVILDVVPENQEFYADPDRILQVLTNLLSNAIKFSDSGEQVWLRIDSRSESEITFKVQDQGRGIPGDKLDSIFERFHQVDASDSRKKGGTGLGLAICRSIIEQHGGRIWVESTLDEGSRFYFSLPIQTPEVG